jgi:hypothetical protein
MMVDGWIQVMTAGIEIKAFTKKTQNKQFNSIIPQKGL